jgi:hypothetical protein
VKLFGISQANCELSHKPNNFIDGEIFEHWVIEIFVPDLTSQPEKTGDEGPTVLILDGCKAHHGNAFWDLCISSPLTY